MTNYTTDELVKRESGFENNVNIREAEDITPKTNAANAQVESAVSAMYSLPLSDNSNYTDSPAEAFLQQTATSLGACLVMKAQYEGSGGSTFERAVNRCEKAMEVLKNIINGNIKLIGSDGVELSKPSTGKVGVVGYPNSDTEASETAPMMTINKVF